MCLLSELLIRNCSIFLICSFPVVQKLRTHHLARIKDFTLFMQINEARSLFSWREFCLVWRDKHAQGGLGPHQHCWAAGWERGRGRERTGPSPLGATWRLAAFWSGNLPEPEGGSPNWNVFWQGQTATVVVWLSHLQGQGQSGRQGGRDWDVDRESERNKDEKRVTTLDFLFDLSVITVTVKRQQALF